MSDADDAAARGRRLLDRAQHTSLQEQMEQFVEAHTPADLGTLRARLDRGTPLSKLVDEGRDERF